MKNCIITGAGRSGTSMLAGCLHKAGYFFGENLHPARESNPKGFFEDMEVNTINENILEITGHEAAGSPFGWRWLKTLPEDIPVVTNDALSLRIQNVVSQQPYCFKDPRFAYTLPVWQPFLENVQYLCVFRDPEETASSMVKECRDVDYLHFLQMTCERTLAIWHAHYRRIICLADKSSQPWLFLHYDQILSTGMLPKVGEILECEVDLQFPDPTLKRTVSLNEQIPDEMYDLYNELCARAHYTSAAIAP